MNLGPKSCRDRVKRAIKQNKVARRVVLDRCERCGLCAKMLRKHGRTPRVPRPVDLIGARI
jgi:hypothetical protein